MGNCIPVNELHLSSGLLSQFDLQVCWGIIYQLVNYIFLQDFCPSLTYKYRVVRALYTSWWIASFYRAFALIWPTSTALSGHYIPVSELHLSTGLLPQFDLQVQDCQGIIYRLVNYIFLQGFCPNLTYKYRVVRAVYTGWWITSFFRAFAPIWPASTRLMGHYIPVSELHLSSGVLPGHDLHGRLGVSSRQLHLKPAVLKLPPTS